MISLQRKFVVAQPDNLQANFALLQVSLRFFAHLLVSLCGNAGFLERGFTESLYRCCSQAGFEIESRHCFFVKVTRAIHAIQSLFFSVHTMPFTCLQNIVRLFSGILTLDRSGSTGAIKASLVYETYSCSSNAFVP